MNKAILLLGVVLIVAGIAYALVDSYDVMVDEGYGHWEPDPPNQTILPFTHTWVQDRPAIYETRYPNLTVGAIVALIGLVTAAISYALEDFDYSVKPEVERETPLSRTINKVTNLQKRICQTCVAISLTGIQTLP